MSQRCPQPREAIHIIYDWPQQGVTSRIPVSSRSERSEDPRDGTGSQCDGTGSQRDGSGAENKIADAAPLRPEGLPGPAISSAAPGERTGRRAENGVVKLRSEPVECGILA